MYSNVGRILNTSILAIGLNGAVHAQLAPYTSDVNTRILYHLEETGGSAVVNSATASGNHGVYSTATGDPSAPAALVSATGYPGFGNALNNLAGGTRYFGVGVDVSGDGAWNYDGASGADDFNFRDAFFTNAAAGVGAFTFEAMVNVSTLSPGDPQEIWSSDTADGSGTRTFQFRIDHGGTLRFDAAALGTSSYDITFDLNTLAGSHAFAANEWFHVAVTYSNDGVTPAVTRLYWTRVSSGTTQANLVAEQAGAPMTGFASSTSANLVFGNEGRTNGGMNEGFQGLLDEGRVSTVARAADAFIFSVPSSPADTDADGLADAWEIANFGNIDAQDGAGDPDGDGAFNEQEESADTNPNDKGSFPDADSDGLYDGWETANFGSIGAQNGGGDPDSDGFTNAQEYAGGSDPNDGWSVPDDLDADGLSDTWETSHFGSLTQNSYGDDDLDGFTNLAEMKAGTLPTSAASAPSWKSPRATPLADSKVTTNALMFASGATYGRAINGISYQEQVLLTFDGYQYAAWYDNTTLTVFLARRTINGPITGNWEVFNTGSLFVNGVNGDAHNVISLGICATDGTLHMSWDHHSHTLRYRRSVAGLCTTNKAAWGPGMMNAEQNWLVASGHSVPLVTYPLFISSPTGGLVFQWRYGTSGNGANMISNYNPTSGDWNTPVQFDSSAGTYVEGAYSSTNRNAYLNGVDFGPDGKLHITWTYREGAGTSNHDLCYAYSTDSGVTWRNNAGAQIANTGLGEQINLNSPGIFTKRMDMKQLLINQQAQCVDDDGTVHMLTLHRREDPGYEYPNQTTALFSIIGTAYYHYFRDPATGRWAQSRIPPAIAPVGSRPTLGYDAEGNLYAAYLTYTDRSQVYPGYRGGYLAIATASKASSYTDWEVVYISDVQFNGEPRLDQARLEQDNILSIFIQEDSISSSAVGTPLHIIEFDVAGTDSDDDGLSDAWETVHFGNLGRTGTSDPDGDGFDNKAEQAALSDPNDDTSIPLNVDPDLDFATNAQEAAAGSNPYNAASVPDTDLDTLNDGWEIAHFGNLTTGNVDSDGDGASNAAELAAGSNPLDATWTPTKARLAHRWSFNGSLEDSAGNSDATIVEVGANNATLGVNSVTMVGGAKGSSDYVRLGSNLLNGRLTPVTIELWANQNQVRNWSRIFDFNLDTSENLFMSWTIGTDLNSDRAAWKQAPGAESAPTNGSNAPYTLGVPYHIVMVITPAVNTGGSVATGSRVTVYSAPAGSGSLGPARATFDTTYHLANLNDVVDALGWSPWPDDTASATYDEVRIWDGALTTAQLELQQSNGPDLIGDPDDLDGDGLRDSWETAMFGNTTSQTASGDADHDGTDNLTEQRLGLNPTDSGSRFAAAVSAAEFTWPGAFGVSFTVQRSIDFASWDDIATQPGVDGVNSYSDPAPPAGRAFYRVALDP